MNETKRRNGFVTAWLWLVIIVNLIFFVYNTVVLFGQSSVPEVLWGGLAAVVSLLTVLSAVLLLKWNKLGYLLFCVSTVIYSIVGIFVVQLSYHTVLINLLSILFWWLILQMRKNGKSAWGLLKNGVDYKHCRHIYQLLGILVAVVLICTLISVISFNAREEIPDPLPTPPVLIETDTLVGGSNKGVPTPKDTLPPLDSDKLKKTKEKGKKKEQQKVPYDNMSIEQLWQVVNGNSKDAEALYRLAKYYHKRDVKSDGRVAAFWRNTLIPEGDVQRCLPAEKRELTSVRFVFVMLARSYANMPVAADHGLKSDVAQMLENIRNDNPGYKY